MEADNCGYCNKPIKNQAKAIYKYFPEERVHKKVHFYHLQVKKGEHDEDKAATEDGNSAVED